MDNLETHHNSWAQDTERRQKEKNTTQKTKKMSNTDPTKNTTQKTKKMSNTDPTKNTTQKTKKMSNTDPTKNPGKQYLFLIYSSVMDTVNSSERGGLWL